MAEVDNGQEDGEELSGCGDDGEVEGAEGMKHSVDEELAHSTRN